jgi:DNA-binding MarR family transcriptional regulator
VGKHINPTDARNKSIAVTVAEHELFKSEIRNLDQLFLQLIKPQNLLKLTK